MRTNFQHDDLVAWTVQHRGELPERRPGARAGVDRCRSTRRKHPDDLRRLQSWTKVLGGVLELAEVPGFLENRRLLFEQADSENAEIRAFLWSWWSMHHQELVLVRTLLPLAREHALPIESRTDHGMLVKLGLLIQSIADREYALGDWHVRVVRGHTGTGSASGAVKWRLKPVVENGSSRGEHVSGSVGSIGSLFSVAATKIFRIYLRVTE